MAENFFEVAHELMPPVGYVRDFLDTQIILGEYSGAFKRPEVSRLVAEDDLPIPHASLRENYYGDRHLEYWMSGYCDYLKAVDRTGIDKVRAPRIFERGGCTARATRHYFSVPNSEVWLSDININYINWLFEYFPPHLKCFRNDFNPHLPLPDNYFDLVLAYSVFTHIDEMELAWILEVQRILKPGGKALVTIIDENSWSFAGKHEWLMRSLLKAQYDKLNELMRRDLPRSRFVIKCSEAAAYNCNIFLSTEYVMRNWGRFFSKIECYPLTHNYQSSLVLTK
jgi:SAM-dependent methyltransferase